MHVGLITLVILGIVSYVLLYNKESSPCVIQVTEESIPNISSENSTLENSVSVEPMTNVTKQTLSDPVIPLISDTTSVNISTVDLLSDLPILKLSRHKKYLPAMMKESDDIISLLPNDGFLPDYKSFCWNDRMRTLRCIPGAYIAGMAKCGTTDLYAKLEWHHNILKPPAGKENMYWPRSRVGRKVGLAQIGHRTKETFESYTGRMTPGDMREGNKDAIILDGTPCLLSDHREWETRYPWATNPPYTNADIIHFVSPQAKIVAMVRDPVERLWSDYLYFDRGEKRTPDTFHEQLELEMERFQSCLETRDLRHCCFSTKNSVKVQLSRGIYICFLQDWRENFGDNLLVLTLEEYSERMVETLQRVYEFLEVTVDLGELQEMVDMSRTENVRQDSDVLQGDMLDETRVKLRTFYEPYNVMLARYLQDRKYLFQY